MVSARSVARITAVLNLIEHHPLRIAAAIGGSQLGVRRSVYGSVRVRTCWRRIMRRIVILKETWRVIGNRNLHEWPPRSRAGVQREEVRQWDVVAEAAPVESIVVCIKRFGDLTESEVELGESQDATEVVDERRYRIWAGWLSRYAARTRNVARIISTRMSISSRASGDGGKTT